MVVSREVKSICSSRSGERGIETVDPADSRARGQAVLDYGVAVGVALRGLTDFTLGYGIEDLEEAVLRVRRASPVGDARIHEVAVGLLIDLAPML